MIATASRMIALIGKRSDRDLIADYLANPSDELFAEFVSRHSAMVKRIAADVVPGFEDDIAQATFALLPSKASSLADRDSAAGWLGQTAKRLAMKARTASTRLKKRERLATQPEIANDPVDELSLREVRSIVVDELNRLPDDTRLPLLLCYWDGASYPEAARRLGCSVSTLKRRLDAGRDKLSARLTRRGFAASAILTALTTLTVNGSTSAMTMAKSLSPLAQELIRTVTWSPSIGPLAAMVVFVVAGAGLSWGVMANDDPPSKAVISKPMTVPPVVVNDSLGDPLPPGAIARIGSNRLKPGMSTSALHFDATGKQLFSYSHSYHSTCRFSIWDTATGRELRNVTGPEVAMKAFRWMSDGRALAVLQTGLDEHWLWDVADPKATLPKAIDKFHPAGLDAGQILTVAISPDGKHVAMGRYTGARMRAAKPAQESAGILVYSSNLSQPLQNQGVRWSLDRGDDCIGLAFSPDGQECVGVFVDNMPRTVSPLPPPDPTATVIRFDTASGAIRKSFTITNPMKLIHNATRHSFNRQLPVGYSPDGQTIWIGADDGCVHGYAVKDGEETKVLEFDPRGAIDSLTISPDGKTLAAVVCDRDWYHFDKNSSFVMSRSWSKGELRDIASGERRQRWDICVIEAFESSADGKRVAICDSSNEIRLFDATNGKRQLENLSKVNEFGVLTITPDGQRVITSQATGQLESFDLATGKWLASTTFEKGKEFVRFQAYSPDAKSGYAVIDQVVCRIDTATGAVTKLTEPAGKDRYYSILKAGSNGDVVVSLGNEILRIDLRGTILSRMTAPARGEELPHPHVAAYSDDGKQLMIGGSYSIEWKRAGAGAGSESFMGSGGWLAAYDTATGKLLREWKSRTFSPMTIAPMAAGSQWLVCGTVIADYKEGQPAFRNGERDDTESIQLFDAAELKPIRRFTLTPGFIKTSGAGVSSGVVSPDRRLLAVVTPQNLIAIYETASGKIRQMIAGHAGSQIGQLAFHPNGTRLISTGGDGTALIWDLTMTESPMPKSIEDAWNDLASGDAAVAYAAERMLTNKSTEALSLIKKKLPAIKAVDAAIVPKKIAELDSNVFEERAAAATWLRANADQIVNELESAIKATKSPEIKKQLKAILEAKSPTLAPNGDQLRIIRAVACVEKIGTPTAVELLMTWSKGSSVALLTQEAEAAQKRVKASR